MHFLTLEYSENYQPVDVQNAINGKEVLESQEMHHNKFKRGQTYQGTKMEKDVQNQMKDLHTVS